MLCGSYLWNFSSRIVSELIQISEFKRNFCFVAEIFFLAPWVETSGVNLKGYSSFSSCLVKTTRKSFILCAVYKRLLRIACNKWKALRMTRLRDLKNCRERCDFLGHWVPDSLYESYMLSADVSAAEDCTALKISFNVGGFLCVWRKALFSAT